MLYMMPRYILEQRFHVLVEFDFYLNFHLQSGRSRGFCFVYFDRLEDAVVAKESSSGLEIDYRRIRVDYSITQRPHTPTPGIYKGRPINRSDGDRYHQRRRRSNSSSPGPRRRAPRSPSRSHSRR